MAHSSGAQGQSVGGRAECGLRSTAGCPHHGGWPHADERGGGGKTEVGGYCGLDGDESGCPRRAWTARGHQQRSGPPQEAAALQGSVGSSGDGRRAGELIFGPAVPGTRRHMWYFAAATPGGRLPTRRWPSVEQLALPADCPGPRSWVRPGEAWRWRMGLGVREARGLRTFVGRGAVRILADGRGMCTRGVECCGATYCRGDGTGNGSRTTTKRRRRSRDG